LEIKPEEENSFLGIVKFGFQKILTAMAILDPIMSNPKSGYIETTITKQKDGADA